MVDVTAVEVTGRWRPSGQASIVLTVMGNEMERAISPELAAQGVALVQEASGFRAITIPQGMRQTHNVLLPVESFAQADPFYSPSVNRVFLNPDEHGYERERGKFDLNKNGLLALADAAGIGFPRTERMPRSLLTDDEIGWQATVTIRRQDGTIVEYSASRITDLRVEREKVKLQCVNKDTGVLNQDYFFKRWTQEREVADAKCETKAILRAVRQALKVKGGPYTREQFLKPWVVVSYIFTPDYTDPDVRRMAVEHGYAARSQVYRSGPPPEIDQRPEYRPPQPAQRVELPPSRSDDEDEYDEAEVVDAETHEAVPVQEAADAATDVSEPSAVDGIQELLDQVFTGGKHKGAAWSDVAEHDPGYFDWLVENARNAEMVERARTVANHLKGA
jgi:hypothetical protein